MKQFTLLLIVTLLFSCEKNGEIPEEYKEKYSVFDIETSKDAKRVIEFGNDLYIESGLLVDGIKQGPWITYEEKSVSPKIITTYVDGKRNGPYHEFEVSRLKVNAFCVAGEYEGEYKVFENGVLIKLQNFVNGKIEGEVTNYYPDTGRRLSVLNYKAGIQDGISTYYNEEGFAIQEYVYENGEQISSKELNSDTQ